MCLEVCMEGMMQTTEIWEEDPCWSCVWRNRYEIQFDGFNRKEELW